jgi:hypothetical protein
MKWGLKGSVTDARVVETPMPPFDLDPKFLGGHLGLARRRLKSWPHRRRSRWHSRCPKATAAGPSCVPIHMGAQLKEKGRQEWLAGLRADILSP